LVRGESDIGIKHGMYTMIIGGRGNWLNKVKLIWKEAICSHKTREVKQEMFWMQAQKIN